ncbi:MAG: glycine/sarcosine/betaine reductase selenoprotein B family protein [Rhodospirillales bacterium]|nr:glycine/sarcosine/betaine reductase selenoprotein B family protein [Rhodospirillales bacterium]
MHLHEMPEVARDRLVNQELPDYDPTPCVDGPPLAKRRIALITTAGLHRRTDRNFTAGVGEYRVIPSDTDMADMIMSHVSTNFDRTGFLRDLNVVFPIDRLREMARDGEIGSVGAYHYAFMGATPPMAHAEIAKDLAGAMKGDKVDGVLLAGV